MECDDESGLRGVDLAFAEVVALARPVREPVPVRRARGRVTAEDIRTTTPLPPFDHSATDGYGITDRDLGREGRPLAPGGAARLLTGASIPPGVAVVLFEERCRRHGNSVIPGGRMMAGANIRRQGEDVGRGEVIVARGTFLNARHAALLAAAGVTTVQVIRALHAAVLSNDNELREPSDPLAPGTIHDSNRPMLRALLAGPFIQVADGGLHRDDPVTLGQALAAAAPCDVATAGASPDHPAVAAHTAFTLCISGYNAASGGRPLPSRQAGKLETPSRSNRLVDVCPSVPYVRKHRRTCPMLNDLSLPNVDADLFDIPDLARVEDGARPMHPPRFLLLYGSLRERSYSRFLALEAARLLTRMGGEVRLFDPRGLPLPDGAAKDHPKVAELRALSMWSEGQVWCSPERHGAVSGVFKSQIDWLPLSEGGMRPTQGRTLAVMQVSGGSQSFNAVNGLRVLGRWMRMVTIPNQSSVPKAFEQFDEEGRMKPSPLYDRVVDVMEELMKFTLLLRGRTDYFLDRYSERREQSPDVRAAIAASLREARGD